MRVIAADTETHLIAPGNTAPKLVCASWYDPHASPSGNILHARQGAADALLSMIADPGIITVWQNGPFDWGVLVQAAEDREHALRAIFDALEDGRCRDTKPRGRLLDIYDGVKRGGKSPYSLEAMAARFCNVELAKGADTWRMRYAELEPLPISEWPAEAREYPIKDAKTTWEVWRAQQESAERRGYTDGADAIVDEKRQVRAAWAVHLMSAWGVRVDGAALGQLRTTLQEEIADHHKHLEGTGFIRVEEAGASMVMKPIRAAIAADFALRGLPPPMTEPSGKFPDGQVATDRETLGRCTVPELRRLAELVHAKKILSTFVNAMEPGVNAPINAVFSSLGADSGRMSCSRPNLQNLPRKRGVRQCFIPRPGWVYSSCDYSILELRTLAQATKDLGIPGRLIMALQGGLDPHSWFGASLAGQSYEAFEADRKGDDPDLKRAAKDWRQLAKVANFGFPGGLGAEAFVSYAASGDPPLIVEAGKAKALKEQWLRAYPELRRFFDMVGSIIPAKGRGSIRQLRSSRVRGGCWFNAACNTLFQGLAADLFKEACWRVTREAWLDRSSVLYGSRPVVPVHDELVCEHPEEIAGPAAQRVARIMEEAGATWTPDVPHKVEPALMTRWEKAAEPLFNENGELIPWDADAA